MMELQVAIREEQMQFGLCYVRYGRAYFSNKKPTEVWGDDWNDAPYEHNAGNPYMDKGEFVVVAWDAKLEEPGDICGNSPYSVEHINHGTVPWLREWEPGGVKIWAGTTLEEFIRLVMRVGGRVFVPCEERK